MEKKIIKLNASISFTDNNPTFTSIRKQKREETIFKEHLLNLANSYLSFENLNTDIPKREIEFKRLNKKWIEYVMVWNNNPQHVVPLRITDFVNLIKSHKAKQNGEDK